MTFNLPLPPGFRGLDPDRPIKIYIRNLPHWRQEGATYFATFHLSDALPASKRNELASMRREWELRNPPPRSDAALQQYAQTTFRLMEEWMDAGNGACWFRRREYAAELSRAILHFHKVRYEISSFVNMANHCHLVIRPFDGHELEEQIGAIKSVTARFINRAEGQRGDLWQQESYDRIIRDAEHLYRVVQYMGANPRPAGIDREHWNRWINPEWQSLGWDFHDD